MGKSVITTNFGNFELEPGDIFMIPESVEHSVKSYEPRACIIFDIMLD